MKIGDYVKFVSTNEETKGLQYGFIDCPDEDDEVDTVSVQYLLFPRRSCTFTLEEFEDECTIVSEEEALKFLDEEIQKLNKKMSQDFEVEKTIEKDIKALLPSSDKIEEVESKVTALVPSLDSMPKLVLFGKSLETKQNELEKKSEDIKDLVKRMQELMEIRLERFKVIVESVSKIITKFQKMVWNIEIYLGVKESIIQLMEGQPADINEKIRIRQRVLYMDEESMILAEEGGLDFRKLEDFDDWLVSDKKHIEGLIPEIKGVVVMKIRRSEKEYSEDPWINSKLKAENKKTYFLIRNGENLYRIWTDFEVGSKVFLSCAEVEDFFVRRETDYDDSRRRVKERKLKPGDYDYGKAQKEVRDYQEDQFRTMMFMAGIIDRTSIFKPFPQEFQGKDIMKPDVWNELVTLIYDSDNLLPTKRPLFDKFRKSINSQIEVGTRIVGRYRGDCVSPKSSYRGPHHPPDGVYELEGKRKNGFFFRYKDPEWETWNWNEGSHESRKRASYFVSPDDCDIINYDKITLDDIEYYLNSRVDRVFYLSLIPVLTRCRRMKREELEVEKMFKDLIYNKLKTLYPNDESKLLDRIDDLVFWWKNFIKVHRSIMKDDAKAYRMIMKEYKKRYVETSDVDVSSLVKDNILYIGERANIIYVFSRYYSSRDLVYETRYVFKNQQFVIIKEKFVSAFENRLNVFRMLYMSKDCLKFNLLAKRENYMTKEEQDSIINYVLNTKAKIYLSSSDVVDKGTKFVDWYDIWVSDYHEVLIRWYEISKNYRDEIEGTLFYKEIGPWNKISWDSLGHIDSYNNVGDPSGYTLAHKNSKCAARKEVQDKIEEGEKDFYDTKMEILAEYLEPIQNMLRELHDKEREPKKFELLRDKKERRETLKNLDNEVNTIRDLLHEKIDHNILPTEVPEYLKLIQKYLLSIPKVNPNLLKKFRTFLDKKENKEVTK